MAAPTQHAETHTTANGTDPQSTSAIAVSTGDLIVIIAEVIDNTAPQIKLKNGNSTVDLITEDEDILPSGTGSVVYGDSSGTNLVKYDTSAPTSGANIRIWSVKVTSAAASLGTVSASVTWGGTSSVRRLELFTITPGSGNSFPVRASRIIGTGSASGWATGAGDQSITISSSDTGPQVYVAGVHHGTSTLTVTADPSNDGTFELTDQMAQANSSSFIGYYDTGASPIPGTTTKIHAAANWGLPNAAQVVVYHAAIVVNTVTGTCSYQGGGTYAVTGIVARPGTTPYSGGGDYEVTGVRGITAHTSFGGGGTLLETQGGRTVGTSHFAGGGTYSPNAANAVGSIDGDGGGSYSTVGVHGAIGTTPYLGGGNATFVGIAGAIPVGKDGRWQQGSHLTPADTWTATTASTGGGVLSVIGSKVTHGTGLTRFSGGGNAHISGFRLVTAHLTFQGGGRAFSQNARSKTDLCDVTVLPPEQCDLGPGTVLTADIKG